MKIAVVGAGAIGGYLGAKLARAGEEVTFIARNRNLEAINARGFRLILEDGSGRCVIGRLSAWNGLTPGLYCFAMLSCSRYGRICVNGLSSVLPGSW